MTNLSALGFHHLRLGRVSEAVECYAQVVQVAMEEAQGRDEEYVAASMHNYADSLGHVGRFEEALPLLESALGMRRRLLGDQDNEALVQNLGDLASCLDEIGRATEALPLADAALAMQLRLSAGLDSEVTAMAMHRVTTIQCSLGRVHEAMAGRQLVLQMFTRLHPEPDAPQVAHAQSSIAGCLMSLGRPEDALPRYEVALEIWRRRSGNDDHPDVAYLLHHCGNCLMDLGRSAEARSRIQEALDMNTRLYQGSDHPAIIAGFEVLGLCLRDEGDLEAALAFQERALDMSRRIYGDVDHAGTAYCLHNVAVSLADVGRSAAAKVQAAASLDMRRRVHHGDHPDIALSYYLLGRIATQDGRHDDAAADYEAGIEVLRRATFGADRRDMAELLASLADCREKLGRDDDARKHAIQATETIERLWWDSRVLSEELRQSYFDHLKNWGAFEVLQRVQVRAKRFELAFHAAEASRNREFASLQGKNNSDSFAAAKDRARRRGDTASVVALDACEQRLTETRIAFDQTLQERLHAQGEDAASENRGDRVAALEKQARSLVEQRRKLLDESARLMADSATQPAIRTLTEIQAALTAGELLLEFTISPNGSLVYVVAPEGPIVVSSLDTSQALADRLPTMLAAVSRDRLGGAAGGHEAVRGRDPTDSATTDRWIDASHDLFTALVPPTLWQRLRDSRRVWIAAHGPLHRLPFEALVVAKSGREPTFWLDTGPAVTFVPSGSVLHWLRRRPRQVVDEAIDLLAIGDPAPRGAAARPDGTGATSADPGGAGGDPLMRIARAGELDRIAKLPPLRGAREEVSGVAGAFRAAGAKRVVSLLGSDATEAAVFHLAPAARTVHFACHGLAEEFAGQSLSMLVLSLPTTFAAEDDGLLKLDDLLTRWTGRLAACDLVVLSACRTQVGRTLRDDAPRALPWGFFLAGARAVIASLWAVDDESTRALMVDFHRLMLDGAPDRLHALVQAKRQLRAQRPDPYFWAPFLFLGCPD